MTSRRPKAFTLVELLVVLAVVAMLMCLWVLSQPVEQINRRQLQCAQNQKQLALGVLAYHNLHGQFPGYLEVLKTNMLGGHVDTNTVTWMVMLIPFIDRHEVWQTWTLPGHFDTPYKGAYVDLFICPSNSPRALTGSPYSYAVNAGSRKPFQCQPPFNGEDGVFLYRGHCSFNNRPLDVRQLPAMTIDRVLDGTSKTLMLSENNQLILCNTDTTQPSAPPQWNSLAFGDPQLGYGKKEFGFVYHDDSNELRKPNGSKHLNGVSLSLDLARPASFHPGSFNVAFCDGYVRFISEDIDYDVYRALMTPGGGERTPDEIHQ